MEIEDHVPLVLVHRPPSFHFPFKHVYPLNSTYSTHLTRTTMQLTLSVSTPTPYVSYSASTPLLSPPTFSNSFPPWNSVCSSIGVDHIDLTDRRRCGVAITNAGVAFSDDVADLVVSLLIDVLRGISAADRFVRSAFWAKLGDYLPGFKLGGKQIGIVGLGSIGSEVAKRLQVFGCTISYNSRRKKPSVPFPYYASIHMVNKEVMAALGKQGLVINVGRGALINEKEMVRFLVRVEIAGAGLDVFENEPDVPEELFELDNVVLSPHCGILTPKCFDALEELIIFNLKAFFSGKPLRSLVKFE